MFQWLEQDLRYDILQHIVHPWLVKFDTLTYSVFLDKPQAAGFDYSSKHDGWFLCSQGAISNLYLHPGDQWR